MFAVCSLCVLSVCYLCVFSLGVLSACSSVWGVRVFLCVIHVCGARGCIGGVSVFVLEEVPLCVFSLCVRCMWRGVCVCVSTACSLSVLGVFLCVFSAGFSVHATHTIQHISHREHTENTQRTHREHTENTERPHIENTPSEHTHRENTL